MAARAMGQGPLRAQRPGWSWPRLPWQRSETQRFRQTPSSPDSQYGFSNSRMDNPNIQNIIQTQSGYTVISGSQHYGVWGPPPPYSDPNSPARRGRMQYNYATQCQQIMEHQMMPQQAQAQHQPGIAVLECHQHAAAPENHTMEQFCQPAIQPMMHQRSVSKKHGIAKPKEAFDASTPSDSDNQRENMSNTLPFRKGKKRVDAGGAKSIGPNQSQSAARVNVQNVFNPNQSVSVHRERDYNDVAAIDMSDGAEGAPSQHGASIKYKGTKSKSGGVENTGFQGIEDSKGFEPESEVYFADVSSCCNTSLKNDTFYDDTNQHVQMKKRLEDNEDYLVQRFGKREASIRSRLPFPQAMGQEYDKTSLLSLKHAMGNSNRNSMMQKDQSRQSMCSMDSGEKTDFTDLSPATPCVSYGPPYDTQDSNDPNISFKSNQRHYQQGAFADFSESTNSNFVKLFPYSTNEQTHESRRRSTKHKLASESQQQPLDDRECAGNTIDINTSIASSTSYQEQDAAGSYVDQFLNTSTQSSNSSVTPNKRLPIAVNISAIIQNIGDRDVGLLYPETRRDSDGNAQESNTIDSSSQSDNSHNSDRRL